MITEAAVRANLEELRTKLARVDEEREVLLGLINGLEGWLRFYGAAAAAATEVQPDEQANAPRGRRERRADSFRSLVLKVIRDAGRKPQHAKDIYEQVKALGGTTESNRPEGVVDLVASSLRKEFPIEKVAPRTWMWMGPLEETTDEGEQPTFDLEPVGTLPF